MRSLILTGSFIALTACVADVASKQPFTLDTAQIEETKYYVSYNLRDPATAQFRNIHGSNVIDKNGVRESFVCGEVNSKNLVGAYVGYTPFIFNVGTKATQVASRDLPIAANWIDVANYQKIC